MADQSSVPFTAGPPETVLPDPPADAAAAAATAARAPSAEAPAAWEVVAAGHPRLLEAWATLAELAAADGRTVEAYAYARVGYHRGLDTLRGAGWRGSGYVRWQHPTNRGFLRALAALRAAAGAIGEADEEERCDLFLKQLDPDWSGRVP
jgi:hypothetical protein